MNEELSCNFRKNYFMHPRKFRNLNVDLPRHTLINQRPWFIAGMITAVAIILISVLTFLANLKQRTSSKPRQKSIPAMTNTSFIALPIKDALQIF